MLYFLYSYMMSPIYVSFPANIPLLAFVDAIGMSECEYLHWMIATDMFKARWDKNFAILLKRGSNACWSYCAIIIQATSFLT